MSESFGLDLMDRAIKMPDYVDVSLIKQVNYVKGRQYKPNDQESEAIKYFKPISEWTKSKLTQVLNFKTNLPFGLLVSPTYEGFNEIMNFRKLLWLYIRANDTKNKATIVEPIRQELINKIQKYFDFLQSEDKSTTVHYFMDLDKFTNWWYEMRHQPIEMNRVEYDLLSNYWFASMQENVKNGSHSVVSCYFATKLHFLKNILVNQNAEALKTAKK